jgi:hypothetical protein
MIFVPHRNLDKILLFDRGAILMEKSVLRSLTKQFLTNAYSNFKSSLAKQFLTNVYSNFKSPMTACSAATAAGKRRSLTTPK